METSGRNLGRYRLAPGVEPRPGVTLRGQDTLLERQVDLLLVPPAAASDPARLERIQREVERGVAFVHPDAGSIYGLEEGDGWRFVVLEPLAGESLADRLAAGQLPPATALEIAAVVCDVLAGAKESGVVHGALYPGDVHLGEDGGVTVGGFGLHELRLAWEEELDRPSTAAGYRAPEAAPGVLPDHRSDLFALGRLLEELLAVDEDATAPAAAESELGDLRRAAVGCLDEEPARRPRSVAELQPLIEAAQRELLREPEPEPEGEPEPETLPLWRRLDRRLRWGVVAVAALLLVVAVWALWPGAGEVAETAGEMTEPAAATVDLAVMPFRGGEDLASEALARGFGEELTRLLGRRRGVSVAAAGGAAAALTEGLAPIQVARRLEAAHLLEGSFDWQHDDEISRAQAVVRLSRAGDGELVWEEAFEAFYGEIVELQDRVSEAVAHRLGGAPPRGAARPLTASLGAYQVYLAAVGRAAAGDPAGPAAAIDGLEQAAILDPGLLLARTRQIRLLARLAAGDPESEAMAAGRQVLTTVRQVAPRHPEVLLAAAELELAVGGDPGTTAEFEEALERRPGHPGLLSVLARIDRRLGRWDEALERLTAARCGDPLNVELVGELVRTLLWKRRFDEAAAEAERLAELLPAAAEPTLLRADLMLAHRGDRVAARSALEALPEAARGERWQARMLRLELFEGDYEAALARLPKAGLEEVEELIERSWIQRHQGHARRAARGFLRARDILDDRLESDPDDPALSSLLGQAYAGTGGAHLGARMGQRAVAQLPVTSDAVGGVPLVERLARIYVLSGDHDHALDELAFLLEIPSPVTAALVRLDPVWQPLRDEPRLRELLERYGP